MYARDTLEQAPWQSRHPGKCPWQDLCKLSIYLSIYLSICLSIYLSIYPSIYIDRQISISIFIIWQAPRAGSMQRVLCSNRLPERARWSDTARPGLPVSFPQIRFRLSSIECTKVFLSPKLLFAKVNRFSVISLSLWNQKKRQRE